MDCDQELKCYNFNCKQYCPSGKFEVDVCLPLEPEIPDCLRQDGGCAAPNMPECLFQKGGCSGFDKCLFDENVNCGIENQPDCLLDNCVPGRAIPAHLPEHNDWICPEKWILVPAFDNTEIINPGAADEIKLEPFNYCKPPELPTECDPGFMPVVGYENCVKMGERCPLEDFAEEQIIKDQAPGFDGRVIYVKPGNTSNINNQDGTRLKPYSTINAALEMSSNKDIIALSKGEYIESLLIENEIALIGACTELTIITSYLRDEDNASITVTGVGGTIINNIKITGEKPGLLVKSNEKAAYFNAIHIDESLNSGLAIIESGNALFSMLKITNTKAVKANAGNLYYGQGILVVGDSTLIVNKSYIASNENKGVFVSNPKDPNVKIKSNEHNQLAKLILTDFAVLNTVNVGDSFYTGAGIVLEYNVKAELIRGISSYNKETGIALFASDPDYVIEMSELKLSNIIVENTQIAEPDGFWGTGIELNGDSKVFMDNIYLSKNSESALLVTNNLKESTDELPNLTIKNIIVEDSNVLHNNISSGTGIEIYYVSNVSIENCFIARNKETGLILSSDFYDEMPYVTNVKIKNISIIDTENMYDWEYSGTGIIINSGTQVNIENSYIARNDALGILVTSECESGCDNETTATLMNLTVIGTKSEQENRSYGKGLEITGGADVTIDNSFIARNNTFGIAIDSKDTNKGETQTKAVFNNIMVVDTDVRQMYNSFGRGIDISHGANVSLTNCFIARNKNSGINIESWFIPEDGIDTTVNIKNCAITNTLAESNRSILGTGLSITTGSQVIAENLHITNNTGLGMVVGSYPKESRELRTRIESKNLSITDTKPAFESNGYGVGIYLYFGPLVFIENSYIARNRKYGVMSLADLVALSGDIYDKSDLPTELNITNMIVENTLGQKNNKEDGIGIAIASGTHLTGKNLHLKANRSAGMVVQSVGIDENRERTIANLENLSIVDTKSEESNLMLGIGLITDTGSKTIINKGYIARNRTMGITASSSSLIPMYNPIAKTELYLNDIEIINTQIQEKDFSQGIGLSIKDGVYSEVKRVYLSNNNYLSVLVSSENSLSEFDVTECYFEDFVVENTRANSLKDDNNKEFLAGGSGFAVTYNAKAELNRFLIKNNQLAGIQLLLDSKFHAKEGISKDNMFGVNIQIPGFNTYDAFENVACFNNEVDFDARDLPVPESTEAFKQIDAIQNMEDNPSDDYENSENSDNQ